MFSLLDHEYFLYNLYSFIGNEELSLRRSILSSIKHFLLFMSSQLAKAQEDIIKIVNKTMRILIDKLSKPDIMENESIYWSIITAIGYYTSWIC